MTTLTLQCTDEDQVALEGDFIAELNIPETDEGIFLAISDGTLLSLDLAPSSTWGFEILQLGPGTLPDLQNGNDLPGCPAPRLTLRNPGTPFQWAVLGLDLAASVALEEGCLRA
jgi:hypothetical protein